MFCDVVDSVALSTRLDPEDLRDVISAYQAICVQSVGLYDGYVARYIGDGVLVYFGYPTAHEDNAERALSAALDIVAAVAQLPDSVDLGGDLQIRLRIGIATGEVVVGDAIAEGVLDRHAVVGEAANLAARLQAVAEPNTVVVSEVTRQLAGERFVWRDLGRHELKGFAEPIRAYQAVERREVTRLQARGGELAALVDRQEETALLLDRWERAVSGNGQVVVLVGQPGIGKSRITAEAINRIGKRIGERGGSAPIPIVLQYSPYRSNATLFPVVRYVAQVAGIGAEDAPASKLAKLARLLGGDDPAPPEDLSLIADLLGIETPGAAPTHLTAAAKRQRGIAALAGHFAECGKRDPVVVVFEDAQWIDPTSKLLLGRLAGWARGARGLIVVTLRPDSRHRADRVLPDIGIADASNFRPDHMPDHVIIREIRELSPTDGRKLADAVVEAAGSVAAAQLEAALAKSGGVPLYIEELVKAASKGFEIPTGHGRADRDAVPHSISDALMAQLDRLADAKDVAHHAAVIGRDFPLDLLAEVMHRSTGDLVPLLDRLIDAGIVVAGAGSFDGYRFKHALIRDIAYQSLLRKNRRQIHCAVARALSEQDSGMAANDLIAQHFSLGAAHSEAIDFWQRGAAQAIARSANEEAIAMLASALAEFEQLRGARQPALELDLVLMQAMALRSLRGYSASEVEQRLGRARELCAVCGDAETQFSVEWGLFQCAIVKGDIEGARAAADRLHDLAGEEPGPRLIDALLAQGMVANVIGEFEAARRFHQTGAERSLPETDDPRFLTHGQNAGLFCLSYLARTQCILGQVDAACATIERARAIAARRSQDPGHIHSCINVAVHAVRVYHLCGDVAAEKRFAEEVIEIARRYHYAYYQALGLCHLGWVVGAEGDVDRGIRMLTEGMAGLIDTGTFLSVPGFHLMLAQLHLRADKTDEAMRSLAMAVGSEGFALWDVEIERVRGDVLARQAPCDDAAVEAAYRASLEIGHRQRAGLLLCKTGLSFARWLNSRGRQSEAYPLLNACLAPLQNGNDVPVVRQARAAMQELAVTVGLS